MIFPNGNFAKLPIDLILLKFQLPEEQVDLVLVLKKSHSYPQFSFPHHELNALILAKDQLQRKVQKLMELCFQCHCRFILRLEVMN